MKDRMKFGLGIGSAITAGILLLSSSSFKENNYNPLNPSDSEILMPNASCKGVFKEINEVVFLAPNRIYLLQDTIITASDSYITTQNIHDIGEGEIFDPGKGNKNEYDHTSPASNEMLIGWFEDEQNPTQFPKQVRVRFRPEAKDGISGMRLDITVDCNGTMRFEWPFNKQP